MNNKGWFTFGFGHRHHVQDHDFYLRVLVLILSENPREDMVALFGKAWSRELMDHAAVMEAIQCATSVATFYGTKLHSFDSKE